MIYGAKIIILNQITTYADYSYNCFRCDLWCKNNNSQSNHNTAAIPDALRLGVIYGAKIIILNQITTNSSLISFRRWCDLWCKNNNSQSNHNGGDTHLKQPGGVIYGAKIIILNQITTLSHSAEFSLLVWLWCKNNNSQSNHNHFDCLARALFGVIYGAKIIILNQITTNISSQGCERKVWFMVQK